VQRILRYGFVCALVAMPGLLAAGCTSAKRSNEIVIPVGTHVSNQTTACFLPGFSELDTPSVPHAATAQKALTAFLAHGSLLYGFAQVPVGETAYPHRTWHLESEGSATAVYGSENVTLDVTKDGLNSWFVSRGSGSSESC
jgi:hypothetical protein